MTVRFEDVVLVVETSFCARVPSDDSRSERMMSASCGYKWDDRNVKVDCGGADGGVDSAIDGGMLTVGTEDCVRGGDAARVGLVVDDSRAALWDL